MMAGQSQAVAGLGVLYTSSGNPGSSAIPERYEEGELPHVLAAIDSRRLRHLRGLAQREVLGQARIPDRQVLIPVLTHLLAEGRGRQPDIEPEGERASCPAALLMCAGAAPACGDV